jgi:hypothetical protein
VFEIRTDFSDFYRLADELGVAAREVRFAAARTVNDAVFQAKDEISGTVWPRHVTQRQTNFPRATLHVNEASKENLTASLEETRSNILRKHDEGATITAQSRALVVPTSGYRRDKMTSSHGLKLSARLAALLARASAKRSVRIKADRVYVAKRGGPLQLAFVLKHAITQRADVPLTESFNEIVEREVSNKLVDNMARALGNSSRFLR